MPTNDARDVVNRFSDALNAGDIDAVMVLMASDCLFEVRDGKVAEKLSYVKG